MLTRTVSLFSLLAFLVGGAGCNCLACYCQKTSGQKYAVAIPGFLNQPVVIGANPCSVEPGDVLLRDECIETDANNCALRTTSAQLLPEPDPALVQNSH